MMAFENYREQRILAGKQSAQKRLGAKMQLPLNDSSTSVQQPFNERSTAVQQEDIIDIIDKKDIVVTGRKLKKFPPSQIPLVKIIFKGLREQRGYNTTQPAAEALAINQMLSEKFTPEQILKAHDLIKKQPFYQDKPVSMMLTRKNIHEVLNNGRTKESHRSIPGNRPAGAFDDLEKGT